MSFSIWIRKLFTPTINQVYVVVYENGREKDLSVYDNTRLNALIECVNMLWKVPDKSPYWFETDAWEERHCFQRPLTKMVVTCYREDMLTNGFKAKAAIPMRYRNKMFDQCHPIHPETVGLLKWPSEMTVRFRCREYMRED